MRYHSLTIEDMPEDFVITSRTTDDQAIMGIQHRSLPIYGFQYHPESIGTPDGLKTIENFVKLVKERKMKQVLAKVAEGMDLTGAELEAAMEEVVAGRASEAQVTALLLGLKMKGETVEERTAIAKLMQAHAVVIPTEVQGAMDNCGTGAIVLIVSIFQQQLPSSLLVVASRWRNTEIVQSLLNPVLRMC